MIATRDRIVASIAANGVAPIFTNQAVIAVAACDTVVAVSAVNCVGTTLAGNDVLAITAKEAIAIERRADNHIVAISSIDSNAGDVRIRHVRDIVEVDVVRSIASFDHD